MQIAQVMAGYSLGDADLLRRAMGKKIRAEMEKQRSIFVAGSVKNGVPKGQADTIFELLAKFADYGFNKSHARSEEHTSELQSRTKISRCFSISARIFLPMARRSRSASPSE